MNIHLLPALVFVLVHLSTAHGLLGFSLFGSSTKVRLPSSKALKASLAKFEKDGQNLTLFGVLQAQEEYFAKLDEAYEKLGRDAASVMQIFSSILDELQTLQEQALAAGAKQKESVAHMHILVEACEASRRRILARVQTWLDAQSFGELPKIYDHHRKPLVYVEKAKEASEKAHNSFKEYLSLFYLRWFEDADGGRALKRLSAASSIPAENRHAVDHLLTKLERLLEGPLEATKQVLYVIGLYVGADTIKDEAVTFNKYYEEVRRAIAILKEAKSSPSMLRVPPEEVEPATRRPETKESSITQGKEPEKPRVKKRRLVGVPPGKGTSKPSPGSPKAPKTRKRIDRPTGDEEKARQDRKPTSRTKKVRLTTPPSDGSGPSTHPNRAKSSVLPKKRRNPAVKASGSTPGKPSVSSDAHLERKVKPSVAALSSDKHLPGSPTFLQQRNGSIRVQVFKP